ncbi:hypothetical protein AEP_00541 [Curvibacter sp. AEP1-3]|uniref:hypothetical protein n=1 Tax=Curvibacter sp. AEP1-3 TaxID=1844971 RepID=UPI000B3C56B6|nr:hypothetical protein [Curvibacter sp. AEP1-3]ARV17501.1 hypothetical protein AEP_00541 [Curvibacter sp. AEP1-3]
MKFSTLPPFKATGKVDIYQPGDFSPSAKLEVTVIVTDQWAISTAMERAARWKLEHLGVPADKAQALNLEYNGTYEIAALEPKGVKQLWGIPVEGFLDGGNYTEAKRALLIRQRRLLPLDHAEALAMYGKRVQVKQEVAVAA